MEIEKFTKEEKRTLIKFLYLQNKDTQTITEEINSTITPQSISLRTVGTWVERFRNCEFSVCDHEKIGRPIDPKIQVNVEFEIKRDPNQSNREIGRTLGVHHQTVSKILKDDLDMRKVNYKWIPFNL